MSLVEFLVPLSGDRSSGDTSHLEPHRFDSIAALVDMSFTNHLNQRRCEQSLGSPGNWKDGTSYEERPQRWLGAMSAQEAALRVTQGWPGGADRVLQSMENLVVPPPIDIKRRLIRADQGDELDIHTVYRGDLQHAWTSRRRRPTRSSTIVRIIAQCNLLAMTTFDQMFWRGAAVLKLTDALSSAGYNVEVIGAIASTGVGGYRGDFLATFPLKEARSPLDVSQLAGVMCNAGFHRLYGFRLYFQIAPEQHGHPGNAASDRSGRIIRRADFGADGKPTLAVPYGIGSKASAEQWITECVEKLQEDLHN